MRSLHRTLLIFVLALATLIAGVSQAQPSHDECGCCTELQQMVCDACKVCASHALVASPVFYAVIAPLTVGKIVPRLNPSAHTEDIWHPPKSLS